jgi:hypothetical protein
MWYGLPLVSGTTDWVPFDAKMPSRCRKGIQKPAL